MIDSLILNQPQFWMKQMPHLDSAPSTPGRFKMDKSPFIHHRLRWHSSPCAKLTFWSLVLLGLILIFFFHSSQSNSNSSPISSSFSDYTTFSWGGPKWEKRVRSSAKVRAPNGISVLVTGAAGFVGTHVSAALKKRGDGVLGLDNFNDYYDPSLKRARQALLERSGVFIVEGDINDEALLKKLFEVVPFTHVMHWLLKLGLGMLCKTLHLTFIAILLDLLVCLKFVNPQNLNLQLFGHHLVLFMG